MRREKPANESALFFQKLFPFLVWMPELKNWPTLRSDLSAGFTVALLAIPTSMAYAHLAGLPVYMGLYGAFIPTILAALFGSSRILSTGPVPVGSLLTVVAIQSLMVVEPEQYIQYAILLTFLSGVIQLGLASIGFGLIINFISYPVILGFINGIAVIIASLQLSNLFGVYAASAPHYYQTVWQVLQDAFLIPHWPTVGIALLAFCIIFIGRKLRPHYPHILIAVVITTFISWWTGYEQIQKVSIDQITNVHIQELLKNHQKFPQEMKKLRAQIDSNAAAVDQMLESGGETATLDADEFNGLDMLQWKIQKMVAMHNEETIELKRLRFRPLRQKPDRLEFFVDEQTKPMGIMDSNAWRIAELPSNGDLILQAGGAVVGNIPGGLPAFKAPAFSWNGISGLFMPALVIALLGFAEAVTIAKHVANESRQRLNINQELFAQGLAKFVGSFFQSMPVSGGFTRSAVNYISGARTGFASIFTGLIVLVVLVWFTSLFYYLPYATLAVVIIMGVLNLLDLKAMRRIWLLNRNEGLVSCITFLLTLFFAPRIASALMLGISFSLGAYLYQTMRPRFSQLNLNESKDLVETVEGKKVDECQLCSIVRFNGSLYFANAAYFEEQIAKLAADKPKLQIIILDCSRMNKLDVTGLEALEKIRLSLYEQRIDFWFCRVRPSVLFMFKRSGFFSKIGEDKFFRRNDAALKKLAEQLGHKHMQNCPFHL